MRVLGIEPRSAGSTAKCSKPQIHLLCPLPWLPFFPLCPFLLYFYLIKILHQNFRSCPQDRFTEVFIEVGFSARSPSVFEELTVQRGDGQEATVVKRGRIGSKDTDHGDRSQNEEDIEKKTRNDARLRGPSEGGLLTAAG